MLTCFALSGLSFLACYLPFVFCFLIRISFFSFLFPFSFSFLASFSFFFPAAIVFLSCCPSSFLPVCFRRPSFFPWYTLLSWYLAILVPCYPSFFPAIFLPLRFFPVFPPVFPSMLSFSLPQYVYLANHYLSAYRILTAFYEILYNLILFITYNDTTSDAQRATQR